MKNSINLTTYNLSTVLATLCFVLTFTACSPTITKPLFQDPEFVKLRVTESIYLMPVLDLRVDKTKNLKLDDNALRQLLPIFEKRGYAPLQPIKDQKFVESLVEDDFTNPDSTFLSALGPVEARWLFCPILHDYQSKITFGSTANAEISGYLIDKKRGVIVWRNKGIGQAGEGGLLGMAMKGLVAEEAVNSALRSLALAIPNNAQ